MLLIPSLFFCGLKRKKQRQEGPLVRARALSLTPGHLTCFFFFCFVSLSHKGRFLVVSELFQKVISRQIKGEVHCQSPGKLL